MPRRPPHTPRIAGVAGCRRTHVPDLLAAGDLRPATGSAGRVAAESHVDVVDIAALVEGRHDDTVTTIRLRIATDETANIRADRPARSEATERLDRPLPPSPEPVRGQRGRMQPGDWIALASLVLAVVTYVTGVIKDDGGSSVTQLVTIIEELVHDRAGPPQPPPRPAGATGPTTVTEPGGHTVPPGSPSAGASR